MAVSFDEIGAVDARGVAEATIKWYYDNGKVEKEVHLLLHGLPPEVPQR